MSPTSLLLFLGPVNQWSDSEAVGLDNADAGNAQAFTR